MHEKCPLIVMRLLGYNSPWDADVVPFTFFYSPEMTRSFTKGLVIPRLSLRGEMPFTKVCVTAPYELFVDYCLLSFIPHKQTYT